MLATWRLVSQGLAEQHIQSIAHDSYGLHYARPLLLSSFQNEKVLFFLIVLKIYTEEDNSSHAQQHVGGKDFKCNNVQSFSPFL